MPVREKSGRIKESVIAAPSKVVIMRFESRDKNLLAGFFFALMFFIAAFSGVVLYGHMAEIDAVEKLAIASYALIMMWILFNTIYFFYEATQS